MKKLIHQTSALRLLLTSSLLLLTSNIFSQEKEIYIPKDLRTNNFESDTARWSNQRMALTPNFVVFWERGFGNDLSRAPQLEGTDMTIDLQNLTTKLEQFYAFYKDSLRFILPGSKADRYRMMAMLNYSLEGTAYGGDYDETIGALWIAPNRVQDSKLNCIAHELGHSFQCQIGADRPEGEWQAYGFYEMASQWMLWQVNPDWLTDENYHYEAFKKLTHRAFLHIDNIYHSPYVLQYWSDIRGRDVIGELFREGRNGEDALMTYKRLFGLNQLQMCDEMFEACRHIVGLDYRHAWNETRRYAGQIDTPTDIDPQGWTHPKQEFIPEDYGFNVFPINLEAHRGTITLTFEGLGDRAGWRYGLVAEKADGHYDYGTMGYDKHGTLRYALPAGSRRAWLVVMGAPYVHTPLNPSDPSNPSNLSTPSNPSTWPYRFKLR